MGKRLVYAATPNRTSQHLSVAELAVAGFISAIPATLVAAPAERVKVLLQVQGQGGKPAYTGPVDVVRKLYAEGGLKSIFRGTGATLARDGPGSALYFATYEVLKKKLSGPATVDPATGEEVAPPLSLGAVMFAGGMAGVAMWSLAIPPDVSRPSPACTDCRPSSRASSRPPPARTLASWTAPASSLRRTASVPSSRVSAPPWAVPSLPTPRHSSASSSRSRPWTRSSKEAA